MSEPTLRILTARTAAEAEALLRNHAAIPSPFAVFDREEHEAGGWEYNLRRGDEIVAMISCAPVSTVRGECREMLADGPGPHVEQAVAQLEPQLDKYELVLTFRFFPQKKNRVANEMAAFLHAYATELAGEWLDFEMLDEGYTDVLSSIPDEAVFRSRAGVSSRGELLRGCLILSVLLLLLVPCAALLPILIPAMLVYHVAKRLRRPRASTLPQPPTPPTAVETSFEVIEEERPHSPQDEAQ